MNGFRLGLAVSLLLMLAVGSAAAEDATPGQPEVLPGTAASEAVSLSYRTEADNGDFLHIEGELTTTGALLAYWETLYLDAEPVTLVEADRTETLELRFYPDADDSPGLRTLAEMVGKDSVERIFLYRSLAEPPQPYRIESGYRPDEPAAIERALEVFAHVPDGFMEFRDGYVVQAVSITLVDMVSFAEGGHRFIYARAGAVEPLDGVEVDLEQIQDFQANTYLGQPWREDFYVADTVVLRASPRPDGEAVAELPAGTIGIEKLQTLADGWVKVRLTPEDGPSQTGYVKASQLWIIN